MMRCCRAKTCLAFFLSSLTIRTALSRMTRLNTSQSSHLRLGDSAFLIRTPKYFASSVSSSRNFLFLSTCLGNLGVSIGEGPTCTRRARWSENEVVSTRLMQTPMFVATRSRKETLPEYGQIRVNAVGHGQRCNPR